MLGECSLFAKHYYTGEANAVEPFLANAEACRMLFYPLPERNFI